MEMKIFRATNSVEIARMETAINDWLKTLPPGAAVDHIGTGYVSLDGVPSIAVTVFWSGPAPHLPAVTAPAG